MTTSTAPAATCTGKTFGFLKASAPALMTEACKPAGIIAAKEAALSKAAALSSDLMTDQCKYALEYEAEGQTPINPYVEFLPRDKTFYTYSGSLTTYPCTEGITWLVFEEPMLVSTDDVTKIMAASACGQHTITKAQEIKGQYSFYADNRPLKPLGSRTLSKYVPSAPTAAPIPSAPTVAPTKSPETPVSLAAIVVGSVGLVSAAGALGYLLAQRTAKLQSAKVSSDSPNLLPINKPAAIATDTQTV